ncbi:hypothetical protein LINPERPRIM_LOCUS19949, partial [Linum perenne]
HFSRSHSLLCNRFLATGGLIVRGDFQRRLLNSDFSVFTEGNFASRGSPFSFGEEEAAEDFPSSSGGDYLARFSEPNGTNLARILEATSMLLNINYSERNGTIRPRFSKLPHVVRHPCVRRLLRRLDQLEEQQRRKEFRRSKPPVCILLLLSLS